MLKCLDFVIIGTPKAGTSSLYNWLNAHPQIQGSQPKETFFLMDEGHPLTIRQRKRGKLTVQDTNIDDYQLFFPGEAKGRLRFEATTHYFYQETALYYLSKFQPTPLIVFLLRKPSDRIRSSFQFTQENLGVISRKLTFNDYVYYLLNNNESALDNYFFSTSSLWIAKRELELSCYVQWLDIWREAVGKENLKVILFEELKQNPNEILKRLARRLKVDENFWENYEFNRRNRSIRVRNQLLHRLARRLGTYLPTNIIKEEIKSLYFKLQSTHLSIIDNTSYGIKQLDEYFKPWNQKLEKNLNINIDIWEK